MSEKIHVSVIVPAHNEEKYVKRCIDSIKESSKHFKGNVEIIIGKDTLMDILKLWS